MNLSTVIICSWDAQANCKYQPSYLARRENIGVVALTMVFSNNKKFIGWYLTGLTRRNNVL